MRLKWSRLGGGSSPQWRGLRVALQGTVRMVGLTPSSGWKQNRLRAREGRSSVGTKPAGGVGLSRGLLPFPRGEPSFCRSMALPPCRIQKVPGHVGRRVSPSSELSHSRAKALGFLSRGSSPGAPSAPLTGAGGAEMRSPCPPGHWAPGPTGLPGAGDVSPASWATIACLRSSYRIFKNKIRTHAAQEPRGGNGTGRTLDRHARGHGRR